MPAAKRGKPSRKSASAARTSGAVRPAPKKKRDPAIDAYLAGVDAKSRRLLASLRKTIHALVPGVEECISYRLPAFRFGGRVVAGFAARATGGSYYPFSGTTLGALAEDLEGYSQTKSALHFDAPLPTDLVRKLLEARLAEMPRR